MEKESPEVSVLMASFNGEAFLREQLQSIYHQHYANISLVAYDDCSTDKTRIILEEEQQKGRLALRSNDRNIGLLNNFKQAILENNTTYIALSDQDDIWVPNKITVLMQGMEQIEKDKSTPCLVYSDLSVIDINGESRYPSFWEETQRGHYKHTLETVIFGNVVNGCASLINPSLSRYILEMPEVYAQNHDGWLALSAFTFGNVKTIRQPLVRYRQHEDNLTYSNRSKNNLFTKVKAQFTRFLEPETYLKDQLDCAEIFLETFEHKMDPYKKNLFKDFLSLRSKSYIQKRKALFKAFDQYWL